MRHTHTDDRLTFGCPGCIHDRNEARWTNAPIRTITFEAVVPTHVAMIRGKPIRWKFTADRHIPDDWHTETDLDYGRFDVGAEMIEAMPRLARPGSSREMDAIATAELFIDAVSPLPTDTHQEPLL